MQYLFVVCGAFSALFSLILISKAQKRQEHWFLGTIFFLVTVNCAFVFAFSKSEEFYYVPLFSELNYAIPLLYGPLLWFYTKAVTLKHFEMRKLDYVHFIPFFLFLAIILVPTFSSFTLPETSQLGYPLIKLVQAPFYLFSILIILSKYRKQLLQEYSYQLEVNLIWLNWITVGAIILWLIGSISFIFNLFNEGNKILLYDYYTLSFLAFFLFALAFIAFQKTDLFYKSSDKVVSKKVESLDIPIVEAPALKKEEEDISKNDQATLEELMQKEKPFLDPLLTLSKLSSLSGIPAYRLTKLLKSKLDCSFYDYINDFRVQEVIRLLKLGKAKQLSMLGIANESGFNSKASFNRVFKKVTGKTPSEFLSEIKV